MMSNNPPTFQPKRSVLYCFLTSILTAFLVSNVQSQSSETQYGQNSLGLIYSINGDNLIVEFDTDVRLQPGSILAIYGLQDLEVHPLTQEVLVEKERIVAKAQVAGQTDSGVVAKLKWKVDGIELKIGMDVIALSDGTAPNLPPKLNSEIPEIVAPVQSTVIIDLPIHDPDGDNVSYKWQLEGPQGRVGYFDASLTRLPKIRWFAPGTEVEANISVISKDDHGDELRLKIPISTTVYGSELYDRELKSLGEYGGDNFWSLFELSREDSGQWWATDGSSLITISSGWRQVRNLSMSEDSLLFQPLNVVPFNEYIYILDGSSRSVVILNKNAEFLRSFGSFNTPTDLVIGNDGTVFVADQNGGGIQVYEPDGSFRARLGRTGKGEQDFVGLSRLALSNTDVLYGLDSHTGWVHRFDSAQRKLSSWSLKLIGKEIPVDIACRGNEELLVLLANGWIVMVNENGATNMAIRPPSAHFSLKKMGRPNSILVDLSGEIYVTYPDSGLVSRYNSDGYVSGLRGSSLWNLKDFAADGAGNIYGLHRRNGAIHHFDHEGWLIRQFGGLEKNGGPFKQPMGLAVSPDGRALLVFDNKHKSVFRFNTNLPDEPIVISQPIKNVKDVIRPTEMVMDESGRAYIFDNKRDRISIFDEEGQFLFDFGRNKKDQETNKLDNPKLMAVHPDGNAAYIYDSYQIKKFFLDHDSRSAIYVGKAGGKGKNLLEFKKPILMACDRQGLLYVLDSSRRDLQVVDYRGISAVGIYAKPYKDWKILDLKGTAINPDGRLHFVNPEGLTVVGW